MVRSYFTASLDRYVERLNDTGLPERSIDALRQELDVHEDAIGGFDDLSDQYLDAGTPRLTGSAPLQASQTPSGPKTKPTCAGSCARPAGVRSQSY